MQVSAILKGVHLSPQKARLVADLVRGKKVDHALNILNFTPKKVLRSSRKLLSLQSLMLNITMGLILTS
jgi:large subunit ribosomal protein L22